MRAVPLPELVLDDFPRDGDNEPDLVEGEQGLFDEFLVMFDAGDCLVLTSLTGAGTTAAALDDRLPAGFAVGRVIGFGVALES